MGRNEWGSTRCLSREETMVDVVTIEAGDGVTYPKEGDIVSVYYSGYLQDDGFCFDSKQRDDDPFRFTIGKEEVILGWDEGILRMTVGEKAMLHIEADFAYGEDGTPDGLIPPDADLRFEVELVGIN